LETRKKREKEAGRLHTCMGITMKPHHQDREKFLSIGGAGLLPLAHEKRGSKEKPNLKRERRGGVGG